MSSFCKTTVYSMSLSPFVCLHWTFELRTSFQSIFTTLRANRVRNPPFGLCQLAGVLRRPNGMRYTVWCPKRRQKPFSSPQHQSTCGRHAMCIGDHDVYHRSDRSVFKWDAIESAPTSKCLRVTQETFKQNSWVTHSTQERSMRKFNAFVLDFRVLAGKLGWLTCGLGVLLSCPRQGRPYCAGGDTRFTRGCTESSASTFSA